MLSKIMYNVNAIPMIDTTPINIENAVYWLSTCFFDLPW